MWTHGWYGRETSVKILLKKIFFNMSDGVFLYGNFAKQLMIDKGFNSNKLHVIYNSLDYFKQLSVRNKLQADSIFVDHFKNSNKVLIFIGRLTRNKRLDLLVKALIELKSMRQYFNLVFVGDGDAKGELEKLVSENFITDNVWFYGACYDETINARLIYNADLCVSPGFVGLTAMHSMMFGTPVITHNDFTHQAPEFEAIKDGVTGSFFKFDNISSLVETISSWFNNSKYNREEIRRNCFEEIDSTWNPGYQLKVFRDNIHFD